MKDKCYFIFGMPESGKTTFLVSLYRMLVLGEKKTALSLDNKETIEGFENINDLVTKLSRCIKFDRTKIGEKNCARLPLCTEDGDKVELVLPDISGEVFRDIIKDRRISVKLAESLWNADELLLFINLDTMTDEELYDMNQKSAMAAVDQGNDLATGASVVTETTELEKTIGKPSSGKEQTIKHATQSDLLDLIQCITCMNNQMFRMKIIISAWDLVESEEGNIRPDEFVEQKMPIIYQFLTNHSDQIVCDFYGMSAQGGDFENEDDKKKIQSGDFYDYVKVIDHNGNSTYDLTKVLLD